VIATSRNPDNSDGLRRLKEQYSDRLFTHTMDVTNVESISKCAQAVTEQVSHLNLLFNVAGVLHIPGAYRTLLQHGTQGCSNSAHMQPVCTCALSVMLLQVRVHAPAIRSCPLEQTLSMKPAP
jgi:NAD(P)-dependent dehydrogenase (short-subunit alcohol dehydrogenase family)